MAVSTKASERTFAMAKQNQKGANPLGLALSPFETFGNPLTLTTRITERQYGHFSVWALLSSDSVA
jgi:hypothetical protein